MISLKKFQKFIGNKKRRNTEKEVHDFQELTIFDNESDNKSISCIAESIATGEISSSSSKQKTGLDRIFIACLSSSET